ncbi:MAG: DNA-binding protein [Candidatus Cloacimonetes bacterium]|nr:DNA-binding protein [Candidatus Cloacimonadota bacterium]
MQSKCIDDTWVLRFDPGEEIMHELTAFCAEQGIATAELRGIGAARRIRAGLFNTTSREYVDKTFEGEFEITSLLGNITRKEGGIFAHVHISFANEQLQLFGGHLFECEISATCEIVLRPLAASIERTGKASIGLHTIDLD